MVTHDVRFSQYAERTVHLFDGRIVEESASGEVDAVAAAKA
ncbi:MAG: ABC-type lipoprotein export system ATPase subunit [Candidatus Binatia bacterium]|jgi:ABC-type lipoprotein export system ATPase subunit